MTLKKNLFLLTVPVFADLTYLSSTRKQFFKAITPDKYKSPLQLRKLSTDDFGLSGYGCWCIFDKGQDSNPKTPQGEPVDEFDANCKRLYQAYRCMPLDYPKDKEGNKCNPKRVKVQHPAPNFLRYHSDDHQAIYDECLRLNENECEAYTCQVEQVFLLEDMKIFLKHGRAAFKDKVEMFSHPWGTNYGFGKQFDFEATCIAGEDHRFLFYEKTKKSKQKVLPLFANHDMAFDADSGYEYYYGENDGYDSTESMRGMLDVPDSFHNINSDYGFAPQPNGVELSSPVEGMLTRPKTPSKPKPPKDQIQCCGQYPYRFPYNNKGGNVGCCGRLTFHRNDKECCAYNFLTEMGNCFFKQEVEEKEESWPVGNAKIRGIF